MVVAVVAVEVVVAIVAREVVIAVAAVVVAAVVVVQFEARGEVGRRQRHVVLVSNRAVRISDDDATDGADRRELSVTGQAGSLELDCPVAEALGGASEYPRVLSAGADLVTALEEVAEVVVFQFALGHVVTLSARFS